MEQVLRKDKCLTFLCMYLKHLVEKKNEYVYILFSKILFS